MVPIAVQMLTAIQIATMMIDPSASDTDLINMLYSLLLPTLGAIFSGAVCGNHISPIAETTIMSANSAGCYPIDHAYTQFWYALPTIVCAGICYLISGLVLSFSSAINAGIALSIGLITCLLILTFCNRLWKIKKNYK
jgi:Na+/H+ antiporter NhaC